MTAHNALTDAALFKLIADKDLDAVDAKVDLFFFSADEVLEAGRAIERAVIESLQPAIPADEVVADAIAHMSKNPENLCTSAERVQESTESIHEPAASAEPDCWCEACKPLSVSMRMIVCPTCGNKRCPHATDHRNECTNSNDPGQPGSSYAHCAAPVAAQPNGLRPVDECAASNSRFDGYKDDTSEQFHYMNGYRRACTNDRRAAPTPPADGQAQQERQP